MRETITVQVGQCGNQIGGQFWSKLLQEHEQTPDSDEALSAFFRFSEDRAGKKAIKARALLIDMECGPLQETMRSPLGSLFDDTQFVMDVYGSGNNFAHGHFYYGPQYRDKFEEGLRKNAEQCDSLQTFLVTHSLSGGTGSGVGTYVLSLLDELYPEVYRYSTCVFPSEENDVVTAPYNSILATKELIEHADCVFPIDNLAVQKFVKVEAAAKEKNPSPSKTAVRSGSDKDKGFDEMNEVAARMLCHLTSSCRFHGDMNVDLNEICTNLVPFPRMHFLMTSLSPMRNTSGSEKAFITSTTIAQANNPASTASKTALHRAFADVLAPIGQLSGAELVTQAPNSLSPLGSVALSSAYLARGDTGPLSDLLRCVNTSNAALRFPHWNRDACKIGVCSTPGPGQAMGVMGVFNSTSFANVLLRENRKFNRLFKRKAMLHHYTEFVDADFIDNAEKVGAGVIEEYRRVETSAGQRNNADSSSGGSSSSSTSRIFDIKGPSVKFPAF